MFMHSKSCYTYVSHVVSALLFYSWVLLLCFIALLLKLDKCMALSLAFCVRRVIDTSRTFSLLHSINIPVNVSVIVQWLLLQIVSVSLLDKSDQRKCSVIIHWISNCGYICRHWQLDTSWQILPGHALCYPEASAQPGGLQL